MKEDDRASGQLSKETPRCSIMTSAELESLRVKTFANPLRMRILVMIDTGKGSEGVSVKQLSRELGMSHGTIFYHVKQLQRARFIEEAGTREVNGITERFYRGLPIDVHVPADVAATMDMPINTFFEEIYHQTRKPVGRRSLKTEEIYVDERARDEFLERFGRLCAEYAVPSAGKMHLAAMCLTYEVRDDVANVGLCGHIPMGEKSTERGG